MRTLKRPMFRKGGSTNEGIMTGLVDRKGYDTGEIVKKFESLDPFAHTYGISSPVLNTDYTNPENIIKWSKPDTSFNIFNWALKDKMKEKRIGAKELEKYERISDYPEIEAPVVKKPKGDLSGTNRIAMQLLASEKKDKLSDKAKRYAKLLSPNAMKRATTDALIAASEAGQTSTGNTFQDLTNMLTAAAKGSGGARDTLDKANLLAIQEEIQTNIAKATYKPNATESLIALGKSSDPEDQKLFTVLSKGKDADANMIISLAGNYTGPNAVKKARGDLFQIKANSANAETYGGTLPLDRKGEIADFGKMENGKEYYNFLDGNFYKLDEKSEPEVIKKPGYLK